MDMGRGVLVFLFLQYIKTSCNLNFLGVGLMEIVLQIMMVVLRA